MKKLLIVVDFQNDFVNGALGFPGAEELDARIAEKIRAYRKSGDEVWFTLDMHGRNYLQTQEGSRLSIPHCIEGTPGADFYGEVGELAAEGGLVFEKPTFGSKDLFKRLLGVQNAADESGCPRPFSSIELVGLVSSICVISNAVLAKTACPEVPIIVDASCTGAGDAAMNEKALDVMENLQIEVTNRK